MKYEQTPIPPTKKTSLRLITEMSTAAILGYLLRKHKTLLFATWAIAMTINWALPEWQSMLGALLF